MRCKALLISILFSIVSINTVTTTEYRIYTSLFFKVIYHVALLSSSTPSSNWNFNTPRGDVKVKFLYRFVLCYMQVSYLTSFKNKLSVQQDLFLVIRNMLLSRQHSTGLGLITEMICKDRTHVTISLGMLNNKKLNAKQGTTGAAPMFVCSSANSCSSFSVLSEVLYSVI